jgi:hypothetical protein
LFAARLWTAAASVSAHSSTKVKPKGSSFIQITRNGPCRAVVDSANRKEEIYLAPGRTSDRESYELIL